jgi:hypothetical protein
MSNAAVGTTVRVTKTISITIGRLVTVYPIAAYGFVPPVGCPTSPQVTNRLGSPGAIIGYRSGSLPGVEPSALVRMLPGHIDVLVDATTVAD